MIATSGRITALAVGIPLALGAAGWQAFNMVGYMAQTSEHHEASYAWSGGAITLHVSSGSVRVVVGADSSVGVAYTEHYQLKKPTTSITPTSGGLDIVARCPNALFSNNCDINYTLTVPSSARLTIHSGNGSLRVAGTTGALSLDTGDGGITLDNVTGDVQAKTGNGGVHGAALRSKVLQVDTGDGDVDLEWATTPDNASVTSGNGDIRLTMPAGSGPYRVAASTGNGGQHVSVPTDPNAKPIITMSSGNGGVSVGYPG